MSWGWRLPFLSGLFLLPVSFILHFKVPQPHVTPDDTPFLEAVLSQKARLLSAAMVCVTWSASFYTIFVWLPTYLSAILVPPHEDGGKVNALVMSTTLPLFFLASGGEAEPAPITRINAHSNTHTRIQIYTPSALSDYTGSRRKVMLSGALLVVFTGPILFALLRAYRSALVQYSCQSVAGLGMSMLAAPLMTWMRATFEGKGTLTCVSLAYNAAQLFGGISPAVVTIMAERGGNVGWWVSGCAVVGAGGVALSSSRVGRKRRGTVDEANDGLMLEMSGGVKSSSSV